MSLVSGPNPARTGFSRIANAHFDLAPATEIEERGRFKATKRVAEYCCAGLSTKVSRCPCATIEVFGTLLRFVGLDPQAPFFIGWDCYRNPDFDMLHQWSHVYFDYWRGRILLYPPP